MKSFTLPDILTEQEIAQAVELYKTAPAGTFAAKVKEKLVLPNLKRIEEKLGQEMDAGYVAYAIEYVLSSSS
jgi:hypothetical protein